MSNESEDNTADDQRRCLQEAVRDQLTRIAQETGGNCRTIETTDGFEIALEFWAPGDDDPSLRIAARCNDPGTHGDGCSNQLDLSLERANETTPLLTLAWRNGICDAHHGLSAMAEFSEGPYAGGKVLSQLRRDIRAALQTEWRPASRALVLRPEASPAVIEAEFQPVTALAAAANTPPAQLPDTALLREALGALPDDVAADAQTVFAHFIAASAHGGPLTPNDIAAFVQEGMAELLAFQEAHLEGQSPGTGIGVGLKGMALIGALITAMGAEFMTGVFAFGPIIGHSIEAAPLAGVGSLLLGGGLMPLAKPGWERRAVFAAAVAWALAVSSLSARNPQLAEPAQAFFQMQETVIDARNRAAAAKLNLTAAEDRLAAARTGKDKAEQAYLGAKKNRPRVLNNAEAELKTAEVSRTAASDAWIKADSARAQAMKNDPSRAYGEAVIFVLTSILNVMGPVFIGKYLERAQGVHADAVKAARERCRLQKRTQPLRTSRKTQEAKAQVLLAAMRNHYAAALRSTGRHSEADIERRVTAAFGEADRIAAKAVDGFRDGIGIRPGGISKLWGAHP